MTDPEVHEADRHTAVINASRQHAPTIQVTAEWRRIDDRWKLANTSLCNGTRTPWLPSPWGKKLALLYVCALFAVIFGVTPVERTVRK